MEFIKVMRGMIIHTLQLLPEKVEDVDDRIIITLQPEDYDEFDLEVLEDKLLDYIPKFEKFEFVRGEGLDL